jgi:phage major head subunit gpT-like protein
MQILTAESYQASLGKLWWNKIALERPSTGMRERLMWLLATARIDYVSKYGGEVSYDSLAMKTYEIENRAATGGFKLNRFQLEDIDGGGVELASAWSTQIGQQAAYWPQRQVATALRAGSLSTSLGYDGVSFFNASHPVNPFDSSLGNYANVFTGAASGVYPGALPIDPSVTIEVAFAILVSPKVSLKFESNCPARKKRRSEPP